MFDGGAGTARELRRRMRESGILNPSEEKGEISILNSRETAEEIALCEKLLSLLEVIKKSAVVSFLTLRIFLSRAGA